MFNFLLVGESRQCDVLSQRSDWSFRRVSESLDEQLLGERVHGDVDGGRRRREETDVDVSAELGQHLVVGDQHLTKVGHGSL